MKASGGGVIINMASVSAGMAISGEAAYAATKAGVLALTRSAAASHAADGIRAVAVSPGPVDTPMMAGFPQEAVDFVVGKTPLRRLCTAEEVAGLVAYLVSDEASHVTGGDYLIDGGFRINW